MITIAFSAHHTEALPYARRCMEKHRVIVLEEAPVPEFGVMLEGRLSIEDYILGLDSGFPEFQRRLCEVLRVMHSEGREILQIEPYLEMLLEIHERLADGATPQDIIEDANLRGVYAAEKRATGALLDYYRRSLNAPFEKVIQAVRRFAKADAERLVLRERLRARAIQPLVKNNTDIYVEAGYIHYPLYGYLRKALGTAERVRVVYLLAPVVRKLRGRRRNMGPGDILTLHYALHGECREDRGSLLAARSLIYIKLLQKDELLAEGSAAPHSEDQASVNRLVDDLSLDDCRVLFDQIRFAVRERAVEVVSGLIKGRAQADILLAK